MPWATVAVRKELLVKNRAVIYVIHCLGSRNGAVSSSVARSLGGSRKGKTHGVMKS